MTRVDIIIICIIGIFTLIGYFRGLFGTAFSLIQFVAVIYLSLTFSPYVSKFLISVFKLDVVILDWVYSHPNMINGTIASMSNDLLQGIIVKIVSVVSLILLFIVLKLIFSVIFSLLNKITKLPIINEVNKLGGILIGAAEGIAITYLLIIVVNWLPVSGLEPIKQELPNSAIGSTINSYVPAITSEIIGMVRV